MDIKILSANIANNPNDFTAKQIENYFEEYFQTRLADLGYCQCCKKLKTNELLDLVVIPTTTKEDRLTGE